MIHAEYVSLGQVVVPLEHRPTIAAIENSCVSAIRSSGNASDRRSVETPNSLCPFDELTPRHRYC